MEPRLLKVAFTGTRSEMTALQRQVISDYLRSVFQPFPAFFVAAFEAMHGDCLGADAEFHQLIRNEYPYNQITTYFVPGPMRAGCAADTEIECKGHISRNKLMVKRADILIGAPPTEDPQPRGGTWATIREGTRRDRSGCYVTPAGVMHRLSDVGG